VRGRRLVVDGHSEEELWSKEISVEYQNFPLHLVISLVVAAEEFERERDWGRLNSTGFGVLWTFDGKKCLCFHGMYIICNVIRELSRMALVWISMTGDECYEVCWVVVYVRLQTIVGRRKSQQAVRVSGRLEVCSCEADWESMDTWVRWSQSMCCVFSDPLFLVTTCVFKISANIENVWIL